MSTYRETLHTADDIRAAICALARSQGWCGRLLQMWDDADDDARAAFADDILSHCTDVVGMVMYLEG